MKGNTIVVNGNEPVGRYVGAIIYGTPVPGQLMQIRAGVEPVNGRHTWEALSPASDGLPQMVAILLEDDLQGVVADINGANAYVSGSRGKVYVPSPGDELNALVKNISGTSDAFTIGQKLIIDDTTGKLIADAATPTNKPFVCMETVVAITADTLVHCIFTGQ